MDNLKTTVEITNALYQKGFTHNFRQEEGKLVCLETEQGYTPDEVEISEHYRTEGESDPGDMAVIYAIQAGEIKGVIVDAFGPYASRSLGEFLQEVEKRKASGVENAAMRNQDPQQGHGQADRG